MNEEEARLIALLESQHEFPGPYAFKVILRNQPGSHEAMLAAVVAQTGLARHGELELRASSTARFVSVSFELHMPQAAAVLGVYRVLGSLDGVVSYF